jgi:hypothetical protein
MNTEHQRNDCIDTDIDTIEHRFIQCRGLLNEREYFVVSLGSSRGMSNTSPGSHQGDIWNEIDRF